MSTGEARCEARFYEKLTFKLRLKESKKLSNAYTWEKKHS